MLDAETQSKILAYYFNDKKSVRAIAHLTGVDRKTVSRIITRKKIETEQKKSCVRAFLISTNPKLKNF